MQECGREGAPDGLAELDAILCEQLGGDAAQSSEHGPPGVDHLDLAIPAPRQLLSVRTHQSMPGVACTLQCSQMVSQAFRRITWRRSQGQLRVLLCPSHSHRGTHLQSSIACSGTCSCSACCTSCCPSQGCTVHTQHIKLSSTVICYRLDPHAPG